MQTLCAMVVFDGFEFGRALADISPWLDMQTNNRAEVVASLEAQEHRRFIKTHTPLDGVPFAEGITYVCVARDPRDVALSFQHHWANLDLDAFMAARARAVGLSDLEELGPPPALPEDPLERFWLSDAGDIATGLCSTCPRRDVRGRFLTGWVRSSRKSPRTAAPAMAATGEGKDRNGATIRKPLLMPRDIDIPGWVAVPG